MYPFDDIIPRRNRTPRTRFAFLGFALFAVKYNLDRLLALNFGVDWSVLSYIDNPGKVSISELTSNDHRFYILLILISIPFIIAGINLCMNRLRDSDIPRYLVFLFFIPVVNIFFFAMLCIVPSKSSSDDLEPKPEFLNKLIPKGKTGSALFACGIPVLIAIVFTLFSVNMMREYGWGLFVAIPFFIGFTSVLLYSYHHQPVSFGAASGIGILGVTFFGIFLFALAMEGLICLAMAFPIGVIISLIGSLVAYSIQYVSPKKSLQVLSINLFIVPLILVSENISEKQPEVFELKTSIIVDATPEKVWSQLIAFNEIAAPEEWLFKTGIAYPIDAEISGHGEGAIRRCNFTTGSFVEPITIWDEPNLLKFDVLRQPVPLSELSFYKSVNSPHIEEYFTSVHGQFFLLETADHKTILEGTTWYKNKMWPGAYWKLWSDYILHEIHLRVLKHIKKESER